MNEFVELAQGLGAGAAFLLVLAVVGAIRQDWIPGRTHREHVALWAKRLEEMTADRNAYREMAFRATGVAEGLTAVVKP